MTPTYLTLVTTLSLFFIINASLCGYWRF